MPILWSVSSLLSSIHLLLKDNGNPGGDCLNRITALELPRVKADDYLNRITALELSRVRASDAALPISWSLRSLLVAPSHLLPNDNGKGDCLNRITALEDDYLNRITALELSRVRASDSASNYYWDPRS
ncbi:hypothetical protein DM01DRAFT_1408388 [Hesseltinella vesiculosa]|uniref:Uncharacterized protein n=1 Tax=Hesseltinella vesiculosa TaxID=101127 RepID=A0A1X2GED4_9FUNG|nr:hypothetical protein DM01DRAFT_1408388 [Hesseltinella vesiculosa]